MYNKKLLSKIDLGKYSKSDPYKKDIIYDPMGQWKYPGQPTRIPSSNISMKGVNLPVLAVTDNGQKKMMQPGKQYNFPGANYVDEFPQAKKGGSLKSKKYTRSLDGIGSLFVESTLFQKPKNNKKRIFHPKAKYYAEGGEPCPEGYIRYNGQCIEWQEPNVIETDVVPAAIVGSSQIPQNKFGGLHKFIDGGKPDNGIITQEEIDAANTAMMKARLAYANEFGNPAAKRMINIPDNPYQFDNGDTGTHYMASYDNYAVPQIQDENGVLQLGDYGPESNEAIKFDSDEDANYFAEHYKDVSPGFINEKKEGGASGCPKGYYWNGKKCVKLLTRVYNNIEQFDKANQLMQDSTQLFNLNAIGKTNLNNRLNSWRSNPAAPEKDIWGNKTGRNNNTLRSYTRRNISSNGILTRPKWNDYTPISAKYINPNIKPIQRVTDKIYGNTRGILNRSYTPPWEKPHLEQNYYDVYRAPNTQPVYQEKPSVIKKFYPKIKDPIKDPIKNSVLPTTRTVYIDCPPGSVSNGQKTDVTKPDPDSPGNYLRTITTGCDPIKEEVVVPTKEPVINKQESPLIEPMGTQEYPEELKGSNWEWDKKYHSFNTPRLNKHFPLGPLFNGKKKHTFSTPSLQRRKDYDDGGSISKYNINTEHDLTDVEVARLKKLGYKLEKL